MFARQWSEGKRNGSGVGGSLGKSHDEGLNRIKGKKSPAALLYQRGHTTTLCGVGGSTSNSSTSGTPLKIVLRDSLGFNPGGSLVFKRVQESPQGLAEKEGVGCFGLIRGGEDRAKGTKSIDNLMGSPLFSERRSKKFSLDNPGTSVGEGSASAREVAAESHYDIAFYRKMQQSVDMLFDERYAREDYNMYSKSSGDLFSDSYSESHDSSEFRRECFFNNSATEPLETSVKTKSHSGSPSQGKGDTFQYSSLDDLLRSKDPRLSSDMADDAENSAQYSNSSTSSHTTTTSSRKNSQVSFDDRSILRSPSASASQTPTSTSSSGKLPPMRSEVSPRKLEKIYGMGTVPVAKRERKLFGFLKMGSVGKRTAKQGKDERIKLVGDDDNHEEHASNPTNPGGSLGRSDAETYEMIKTQRHIIAKQNAPEGNSFFRAE